MYVAYANDNQAKHIGILTRIIEYLRPIGSDIHPDNKLPIGSPINDMLPIESGDRKKEEIVSK